MTAVRVLPTQDDRVRAALWFAERGFGVFSVWSTDHGICRCPKGDLCDNPGKHPITGRGFLDATTDVDRIRTMLAAGSQPNYGLVCPEGVFALDVDGEGVERLGRLEAEYGDLPATLRTNTAHGQHIFLRWPQGVPRPIGQLFGFVTRWGSGRDAGYVIGPRSVHASGFEYAPAGVAFDIADLPERWARQVVDKPAAHRIVITAGYVLPDQVRAGEARYEAILGYTGHLYNRGMTAAEMWPLVRDLLAPRFEVALSEPDVRSRFERAVDKIAERLGAPRGLNTPIVEPGSLIVAPLTEFESSPIEWLWPTWLPRGVVTLMDGNPGVSKSTLVADLAARITTGREWPDGQPMPGVGRVLWITTEDDPGRVLRPRIEAAGGQAGLALFARSEIVFPGAAVAFRELLQSLAAEPAGLVMAVLDPLFSHIDAKVRAIADAEMRQNVMNPLQEAAEAANVSILVIRHFNKDTTASTLNRGAGSLGGIVGAARALWTVTHDKSDDTGETKVVGVSKLNYARPSLPLRYRVVSKVPDGWVGASVSAIEWLGSADISVEQMNSEDEFAGDAKTALEDFLTSGPVAAREAEAKMRSAGFGKDATRRAANRLHIVRERDGFGAGSVWKWHLPEGSGRADDLNVQVPKVQVGPEGSGRRFGSHAGTRAGRDLSPDSTDSSGETRRYEESGGGVLPAWARACEDHEHHRDSHRLTPDGWVCDACDAAR